MVFAAIAILSVLIGFLLGWVGRFAVFAATSLAIIVVAAAFGVFAERGFGETALYALIAFASLQVGYVGYLGFGAVRIARRRRTDARQSASDTPQSAAKDTVSPTYEQSR